jgi:hypothetical protein
MGTEKVGEKITQKTDGRRETGITISLKPDASMPDPPNAPASKHKATGGPPDKVRWHNLTNLDRTIRFKTGWPFQPPEVQIKVSAHGYSAWYYVSPTVDDKAYPYAISPELTPGGGPDDPKISVND